MAGWLLILVVYPFSGLPMVTTALLFYPHHGETVAVMLLTASATLLLGRGSRTNSFMLAVGVFSGIT
jgi:hypothetical protein